MNKTKNTLLIPTAVVLAIILVLVLWPKLTRIYCSNKVDSEIGIHKTTSYELCLAKHGTKPEPLFP